MAVVHELLGRSRSLSVSTLDLRGNGLRLRGAQALACLLTQQQRLQEEKETEETGGTQVETLILELNSLGEEGGAGVEVLCNSLQFNRSLISVV